MRRNSDERLRDLERLVAAGDTTVLAAYDRAYQRAFGLQALADRYAKLLLLTYRSTPEGEAATILVPDGVSDRPDGIRLTARHGVKERRVPTRPGGATTLRPGNDFIVEMHGYVSFDAVLLPGLPEEFYHPKAPQYSDSLHDGEPGAPVERITFAGSREARALLEDSMRAETRNLIRDEQGRLEWVIGWSDREFLLRAARSFLDVRERVDGIEARRSDRRLAGLDVWENVQVELQKLAGTIGDMGLDTDRDVSHLWNQAIDLLRGVEPPYLRGVTTRPINAAGEGWSRWATERLARLLSERVLEDGRRRLRLEVSASPCWLWSEGNNLAMSSLTVTPIGVRASVRVGIAYPSTMGFQALIDKARHAKPGEWERRYPTAGRFEITPQEYSPSDRSNRLVALIETVIRESFPKAIVVVSKRVI